MARARPPALAAMPLGNMGNTCFVNSALHLLFALLDSPAHLSALERDAAAVFPPGEPTLPRALLELYHAVRARPDAVLVPSAFRRAAHAALATRPYIDTRQHAADDFLLAVFSVLPCLAEAVSSMAVAHRTCGNGHTIDVPAAMPIWWVVPGQHSHIIAMLQDSIQGAADNERALCSTCQADARHEATHMFLDDTLIIGITAYDNAQRKIERDITFPLTMDLTGIASGTGNLTFELACIARHLGPSLDSGHYDATVRLPTGWKVLDDAAKRDVLNLGVGEIKQAGTVLAVYHKVCTRTDRRGSTAGGFLT